MIQVHHSEIVVAVSLTAKNMGGHVGRNKTCSKMASAYYWPKMQKDIAQYISTCKRCQWVNTTKLQNVNEELHNIPIPMKLMAQVGIDLIKLKPSKGYNYVITAIDYFTKYVKMGALKDKSALSVARWISDNIFCHCTVTDIHITDNSKEFVNQISKELYSRCNVAHRITLPYHPAVNRLMEILNRTMTEMMIKDLD